MKFDFGLFCGLLISRGLRLPAVWAVLFCMLAGAPVRAQVTGISYTLSPAAEWMFWDGNAALEPGFFLGGQVGLGFGEYVELSGVYLFGDFQSNFERVSGIDGELQQALIGLPARDVRIQRIGGEAKVNLGYGSAVPFVTLGTGVMRFSPEGLNTSDNIYLIGGAGLLYSIANRYVFRVQAVHLAYRYNMGAAFFSEDDLAQVGLGPNHFQEALVSNWGVRVGLQVYLGGREPGQLTELDRAFRDQFAGGLSGVRMPVEPFIGQINFHEETNFRPHQRVAGINAGLDFGPFVGIRGFYWRGLQDDSFTDVDALQVFGGELRLRLSGGEGIIPFLSLGGGYINALGGYQGVNGLRPRDQPFALGGGGLIVPLGSRIRLNAGARAMLTTQEAAENLSQPNQVLVNWMYSGGINLVLGGQSAAPDAIRQREIEDRLARERRLAAEELELVRAEHDAELARARLEADRALRAREAELLEELASAYRAGDTTAVDQLLRQRDALLARSIDPAARTPAPASPELRAPREERFVTLPVPEEGELYIRFGTPGGVEIGPQAAPASGVAPGVAPGAPAGALSEARVQQIVRETIRDVVREQLQETGAATGELEARIAALEQRLTTEVGAAALDVPQVEMERRFQQRLDEIERNMQQQLAALGARDRRASVPYVVTEDGRIIYPTAGRGFTALSVFAGADLFGGPEQARLGVRANYRPGFRSFIRYLPDISYGFGSQTDSYSVNFNVGVPLISAGRVQPYVGVGMGLLGFTSAPEDVPSFQGVFNILAGAQIGFGPGEVMVEYMNMDLFAYNRLLVGYGIRF